MKKKILGLVMVLLLVPTLALAADASIDLTVSINTIWVLMAGFLVFIMHAGFSMVEIGFTRSKNAVNIIMKNFMTIAIGVICYFIIGFALMFGDDVGGFLGTTGFFIANLPEMTAGIPTLGFWFFQAVFAATSATIVSGAIAERTKFSAYLIFCVLITGITYPIVGHWIWSSEGWLAGLGFHDLAGSTVVHAVGGFSAFVCAALVGPRIGKYSKDGKVRVIPGHSVPLGALGVLLLWFGWFGFNPGSTIDGTTPLITVIAVTTLLAGAAGAVSSLTFSWIKYGKPDASLTLNGCLAGLVGITAGADVVSPASSLAIGAIAGIVLVIAVEVIDHKIKVDDPVGAISVHGVCGSLGTILVGVFAEDGGLLYGDGFALLGIQTLGVLCAGAFAATMAFLIFSVAKKTIGIRVGEKEEKEGLDVGEHGISAYADLQHVMKG